MIDIFAIKPQTLHMKTKLLLAFVFVFQFAFSLTNVPGGIVNGTWNLAGSPYNIQGSIQIVNGDSLIIQPGVTVSFQGTYKLLVLGKLIAIGTATDTITFTAANTTNGWRGIRFDNTPSTNDTSRIMYCKVQYGNASGSYAPDKDGGGMYFNNFSKVVVSNSCIINCRADKSGGGIDIESGSPIFNNNIISNDSLAQGASEGGGGVCIKSGGPVFFNNIISNNHCDIVQGAGVKIWSGSATIIGNTISNNNTGEGAGAGIYFENFQIGNMNLFVTITNNTITNNSSLTNSGGGIFIGYASPYAGGVIISNNIISNNMAGNGGGGLYCAGRAIIKNNTITFNTGGGIKCYTSDTVTIRNNFICNNTSGDGGGLSCINNNTATDISDNIIANNNANKGGGIFCSNPSPTFTNNTILNNRALLSGGALYCESDGGSGSNPTFINCILHGNTDSISGPQVFLYDEPSDPSFYYCDVEGGSAAFELNGNFYTGTYQNNLDIFPLFVSPSGGSGTGFDGLSADWSLQAGSPCIDTGDPNGTYPATDIAGNPRVANTIIDIGAYEFPLVTGIADNKNNSDINFYPNPSSGKFTYHSSKGNTSQIEIYNVLGEKIYTMTPPPLSKPALSGVEGWRGAGAEVDLSAYPKGIYFVKLIQIPCQGIEKKNLTGKILIQ